jgi:hypothetical protein
MKTEKHYMTEEEAQAHYKACAASNMRYIQEKLSSATPRQLALVAAFVRGMGIVGCTEQEVTA